ncbi:MAG: hypothetical protein MJ240_01245 [Kiritimatiellae bacterium]|nr:hypothetical protein [Kiritimatiellia bacterium]
MNRLSLVCVVAALVMTGVAETAAERRAAYLAQGMKTPETSKFFMRHEDPESHVVSWIMKPGLVDHNQQHFYFTAKSMTDDGRFLMFHSAPDESQKGVKRRKTQRVLDFLTDELVEVTDWPAGTPFVDAAQDQVWYVKNDGICRRDLLVDPKKEIRVCDFAADVKMPSGGFSHYCTHLTLTPDRQKAFLDWCHADGYWRNNPSNSVTRQLLVDLKTGTAETWGTGDFWINHGQLHPTNTNLAMCAYEGCSRKRIKNEDGTSSYILRPADEVYPRLILVEKGKRTFVPPRIKNYATHEHWSEDGSGFYWCASGVYWMDLATGVQRCICPFGSAHATVTTDNRFITSDESWGGWWRGCGWTTSFYNRDTHQGIFIHSKRPVYAPREKPSNYHPDPHPQFVCEDRYVVCTMNVKDHQMTVSVTPVEALAAATSKPRPEPKRIALDWHARRRADVPVEMELNWKKLRDVGVIGKYEPTRYLVVCPESFGVEATLADGSRRRLAVTPLVGRTTDFIILRFTPPAGATALDLLVGVDGRFEMVDAEHCENLFAGALKPESAARWAVSKQRASVEPARFGLLMKALKVGVEGAASYTVDVPAEMAGKPCRFEADVRSLSDMTWSGPITLEQLDAAGKLLPETVVDRRWMGHMRPPSKTAYYREKGFIHKDAKKIVFRAQMRYVAGTVDNHGRPLDKPERLQPKLLVTHLALRTAAELPFTGYDNRYFTKGVTDDPADSAIVLGGENAFSYPTRSHASWAGNVPMRRDDQIFFPRLAGTIEAWFKPAWKADDATNYSLIEAVHSAAHVEGVYHPKTRGALVEVTYLPKTQSARLTLKDAADIQYRKSAQAALPAGQWTHVACTFSPDGEARLYFGGKCVLTLPLKGFKPFDLEKAKYPNDEGPVELWLGGSWRSGRVSGHINPDFPFMSGAADLLRVSCGVRYAADFTPATNFACDADTCALFGFDRELDGVTAHGPGFVPGSYRALTDVLSHTFTCAGQELRYYSKYVSSCNDFTKLLDNHVYKQVPREAEAKLARRAEVKRFSLKNGDTVAIDCPKGVVTDYIEYVNDGTAPLLYPLLYREGDIDPRSFGDIADTLVATCRTDREKADKIFNFVMLASNYSQNPLATFRPGSDVPRYVEYAALMMLNAYCGFECGPLNNMAANLFACSGNCPSSQTAGYGHSFEQVFYDGKNRIYDLSARKFFPAMDNETVACLSDADREFGVLARWDSRVGGFCRNGSRGHHVQTPAYQEKCGMVLRPGERFRLWRLNNGYCNDLQINSCWPGNKRTTTRPTSFFKSDIAAECRATPRKNSNVYGVKDDDLSRLDRFFPEFVNGFLVFDGKPTAANPAFSQATAEGFVYHVKSCYPVVHAEYRAETAAGAAGLELSTDFGKTWYPLPQDAAGTAVVDYPVRARLDYLVRVKAPMAAVTRFAAVTEVQANRRILPGELKAGKNTLCFKADSDAAAQVSIAYRVPAQKVEVKPTAFTGTIPGCERLLALVDPAQPLVLKVDGVSEAATVRAHGGVKATLAGGKLVVTAEAGTVPRFAAVDILDAGAEKQVTLLVAEDARLVMGKPQMLKKPADKARFEFAPLKGGKYAVLNLTRYQSKLDPLGGHYGASDNKDIVVNLPGLGKPVGAGAQESLPDAYWWSPIGLEKPGERANFKWEYAVDPHSYYPYQMMRVFDLPAGASWAEYMTPETFPGGVEVVAVLVLPEPDRDFKAMLRKVLCGYNCEPWRVTF